MQAEILGCCPPIPSPVVHLERYAALREELGWRELIRQWLGEKIPEHTFHNPHRYADGIVHDLLACQGIPERELFIVVAHDITLFPIISRVFGRLVNPIEFLNGIVITADTDTAEFRFADADGALKAERKIP